AADLGRGVRLGVERVQVAGTALHPQQDAVDGLALARGRRGGQVLEAQEGRQAQAKGREAADAEELPARQAGAVGGGSGVQVEHDAYPFQRRDTCGGKEARGSSLLCLSLLI